MSTTNMRKAAAARLLFRRTAGALLIGTLAAAPAAAQDPTLPPPTTAPAVPPLAPIRPPTEAAPPIAPQQPQQPASQQPLPQQPTPQQPTPQAGAGAPGTDVIPARGTFRLTGDAETMSVFAVSVDAQEILTAVADRANLPLVIDETVSRRITISLENRTARRLLEDIASAYGLSFADVGGVLMISEGIPRSPSSYLLSDITSIPTRYVNAANARSLLPVFLQDHVKVNAEQNAVVLSAPAEVLGKFRDDISQFDIPASQIEVELLLVELTNTTVDAFGLPLAYINGGEGITIDPSLGTLRYQAITDLPNRFAATLRALNEKGLARVRANPRIATVSGRRANIFVGRQRYVATPIDLGDRQGQRNFIDAGVRLNITPFTGGEGQILIDVDAEVSTLSAPDPATNLPEKSTRTASTIVRVNSGQTVVIGGLTQQETREVRTKVPILGDIPLLGPLLFTTRDSRSTKSELVLFITPRLLSNTGHLPQEEEDALKRRYLDSDLSKTPPPGPVRPAPPMPGVSPDPIIPAPPSKPAPGSPPQ